MTPAALLLFLGVRPPQRDLGAVGRIIACAGSSDRAPMGE